MLQIFNLSVSQFFQKSSVNWAQISEKILSCFEDFVLRDQQKYTFILRTKNQGTFGIQKNDIRYEEFKRSVVIAVSYLVNFDILLHNVIDIINKMRQLAVLLQNVIKVY